MAVRTPLIDNFRKHIDTSGDCWLWTSTERDYGAGVISFMDGDRQRHVAAHRISWELHNGPVPAGKRVVRTCHNPHCVNPEHLRLSSSRLTVVQRRFAGVELPGDPPWCSPRDWSMLRDHVQDYRSYEDLAVDHGLHLKTVRRIVDSVASAVLSPPSHPGRPLLTQPAGVGDRDWSIYIRHTQGRETHAAIGRDLGLSRERVRQIVKRVEGAGQDQS